MRSIFYIKNKKKKSNIFQFILFLILLFSYRHAFGDEEILRSEKSSIKRNVDDIFIESKFSSVNENFSTFEQDVVLLKSDMLLNSDELNYIKIMLYAKNIDKAQKKEADNDFILEGRNNFKALLDDGTFVYGKYFHHNQKESIFFSKKVQVFPANNSGSLFADTIIKVDNGYVLDNCLFSACALEESALEDQKVQMFKYGFYDIKTVAEPEQKIITKYPEGEVRSSYTFKPWLLSASKMYIDKIEDKVFMEDVSMRFFGVPLFYSPYFSYPLGKEGQSGLLTPKFIAIGGLEQQGIEIPFYLRLASNIDAVISRAQYFSISGSSYQDKNPNTSTDFGNNRISTTNFLFRHLLSDQNRFLSYYRAEGIITDRIILINKFGGMSTDSSGNPVYGVRGYAKIYSEVALSKNIFLNIDYLWTSDINVLYVYRRLYMPYKKNSISVRYTDNKQNHSFELYRYEYNSLYMGSGFSSYTPVVRSYYDFDKDKIGGNFYYDFYLDYINKALAFKNFNSRIRVGYHLPIFFQNGTKLTLDASTYLQYSNMHLGYGQSSVSAPGVISVERGYGNINYIIGNYSYLINSSFFGNPKSGNFTLSGLNTKAQIEHQFLFKGALGLAGIKPLAYLRYSQPFSNNINNLTNVSGLSTMMDASAVFNFNRIYALSIFEYGASIGGGFNFIYKFKDYLSATFTTGIEKRFFDGFTSNYHMLNWIGLGGISNLFNNITITLFGGISYNANTRVSAINGKLLQVDHSLSFVFLDNKIRFMVGQLYLDRDANFINRNLNMIFLNSTVRLIGNVYVSGGVSWDLAKEPILYSSQNRSSILNYTIGAEYKADCYTIGFNVGQNYITPQGVPPILTYGLKLMLKPQFDAGVSPGGRALPTKELGLDDLD